MRYLLSLIVAATLISSVFSQTAPAPSVTVIRAGVLIDGKSDQPRRDQVIVVRGHRIESVSDAAAAKIPAGAATIDLSHATVLPGLIDSHTHIFLQGEDPAQGGYDANILKYPLALRAARATVAARRALEQGFTTLRDVETEGAGYGDVGIKEAIEGGYIPGPRLFVATRAISTTGGYNLEGYAPELDMEEARRAVEHLAGIFGQGNVYVELQRHFHRQQEARNRAAIEIARSLKLPLLATNGVCYATPRERELCDVFTAIRNHKTLVSAGRLLARNSERHLKSPQQMQQLFADLPEALANTVELSSRLEFTLEALGYEFPKYPVPEGETMMSFLRERAREGFQRRYGRSDASLQSRARRQIERELALIEKLKLPGYFLIVWDLVRFCREENILAQGRGSAANSAVCYSLGLTAVDPISMIGGTVLALIPNALPVRVPAPARIQAAPVGAGD